ncbi:predicted protein [Naegleria gruberi]|uniref:Predicted protein n=1 Tax=Naegleria gruberi TaxID=5762 RepID=D2VLK8_NAEGR|nr:uncharacterized protein NAEGRDRAFT_50562 [Naegleria gruberi]EFC42406.1 predicted protein [Naegleria gruberi]|eukprot:XP_002675150.1 predicted protein [Naegleria gruberi strain NEG-M]
MISFLEVYFQILAVTIIVCNTNNVSFDQSIFDSFQDSLGLNATNNNSNNSLLKLDIDSLFLDPCNWIEHTEKSEQVSNSKTFQQESKTQSTNQVLNPLQTTHSTSIVSPAVSQPTITNSNNDDHSSSASSTWITNNSHGKRSRFSSGSNSQGSTNNPEPTLQKITTHVVQEDQDDDEEECRSILQDEEFGGWFFTQAPTSIILTCNPKFTINIYHKPLGATHSVFVNDDILVHIPRFDSNRIEDLFCDRVQLQMRSYLVSSVVENPNEVINNISQIDHLTALEFYENLSDSRFVSNLQDPNLPSGFSIKVPIKRDNTSKRGKRKEKLNSVIASSSSPNNNNKLPHSDDSDNSSSFIEYTSSPKKKKKGESAPKKIIFLLLIDRDSGDILYRSELLWQRSKTKREMEQKKPIGEESSIGNSSETNQKKRRNSTSNASANKQKPNKKTNKKK